MFGANYFAGFYFAEVYGGATTAIQITLSDSGSGSDSVSVAIVLPLTDTGLGADAISAFSVVLLLSDSGNGSDQVLVVYAIPLVDNGNGIDAIIMNVPISLSDSGSGVDIVSLLKKLLLTDSGSGVDSRLLPTNGFNTAGLNTVPLSGEHLLNNTEPNINILVTFPLSDFGSGIDSTTLQQLVSEILEIFGSPDIIEVTGIGVVSTTTSPSLSNGFSTNILNSATLNGAPFLTGGGTNETSFNTDEPLIGEVIA